jgi:hypothetical protein
VVRTPRKRALATTGTTVGRQRNDLYRSAWKRINEAIENGYHLEAITLIESLVSDRLESRASHLRPHDDVTFKPLGDSINKLRDIEKDVEFRDLVNIEVRAWKELRNKALHEMAKLEDGDLGTWEERIATLPPISTEGLSILRRVDNQVRKLRKSSHPGEGLKPSSGCDRQ